MRSTNQIMIAVQECDPCTEEELRLGFLLTWKSRALSNRLSSHLQTV